MLTDSEDKVRYRVRMDRHKVGRHNSEVVIINAEDPCYVDGSVDHTKNILLALIQVSFGLQFSVIE